jgi:predicted transcriptional regulator
MKTTLIIETQNQEELQSLLLFLNQANIKFTKQYPKVDGFPAFEVNEPEIANPSSALENDQSVFIGDLEKAAILQGFTDIKNGKVISHEEVMALAKQKLKRR